MFRVSITKQSVLTNQATFPTQAEAQAWLDKHIANNTFGLPERPEMIDGGDGFPVESGVILPAEYEVLVEDITAQVQAEQARAARIDAGRAARRDCEHVLDLIAGFNLERELTLEQISQMQQLFGQAEQALRAGRPTLAKQAIQAIEPDGVLVSAEMKAEALALLSNY